MSHSHLVLNMLYKIVYNSEMYGTNLSARANSPSMSSLSCSTAVLGSNFLLIMSAKVSSSQVKVQSAASSASYNFTFFKSNTVYMKTTKAKNVSHLENRPFIIKRYHLLHVFLTAPPTVILNLKILVSSRLLGSTFCKRARILGMRVSDLRDILVKFRFFERIH